MERWIQQIQRDIGRFGSADKCASRERSAAAQRGWRNENPRPRGVWSKTVDPWENGPKRQSRTQISDRLARVLGFGRA